MVLIPVAVKFGSEVFVHAEVIRYLKRTWPDLIFRTDFAAGTKLPRYLAKIHTKLQSHRGFPDIFIFQPAVVGTQPYYGLGLELKPAGTKLRKVRTEEWASPVIARQAAMLTQLRRLGYCAMFARGLDEAKQIINWYLDDSDPFPTDYDGLVVAPGVHGPPDIDEEVLF